MIFWIVLMKYYFQKKKKKKKKKKEKKRKKKINKKFVWFIFMGPLTFKGKKKRKKEKIFFFQSPSPKPPFWYHLFGTTFGATFLVKIVPSLMQVL